MFKIRRHKILLILVIMVLVGGLLIQPVITYGHEDGGGDSGGCSSGDESTTDHSGGSESGKGHYGGGSGGSGGSGGRHCDVTKTEEEEGGSGESQGRKGITGITGRRGSNTKGTGSRGRKDTIGGEIKLIVTVEGLPNTIYEVDVTLTREGVDTSKTVVLEDGKGTVTFVSEASGDCFLIGEDVPGYITPSTAISLIGNVKEVYHTLTYLSGNIPVEGVSIESENPDLNMENLEIIVGYSDLQLVAKILPENASNANNSNVTWESSDESVATVSQDGLVKGISEGAVEITVTTDDGGFTDFCLVTVHEIDRLEDPTQENAVRNELVNLPKTVKAYLNEGDPIYVSVSWKDENGIDLGDTFQVPMEGDIATYIFTGYVGNINQTATLIINVDLYTEAIQVQGISLNVSILNLDVGDFDELVTIIEPSNATNQSVIWTTSDDSIATVDENGIVTGVSPGIAKITVESVDGGYQAYCTVSVAPVAEVSYIYPTLADGVEGEHFENLNEVYINVANLVDKLITEFQEAGLEFPVEGVKYFVKVEDNATILGDGEVTIFKDGTVKYIKKTDGTPNEDINEFNLYDVTNFTATESYSSRYFVSMSQTEDYPRDDEKTLSTNFNVGGTTPTVPKENISVTVEMLGGNWKTPNGIVFLLCRELDLEEIGVDDISEVTWQHYYDVDNDPTLLPYSDPDKLDGSEIDLEEFLNNFNDEVKMKGVANADGVVVWREPKETLKIGGYFLLEVTPLGYRDNLNLINPESDDRELLKAVHLTRNVLIERNVINTFEGYSPEQ